MRSPPDADGQQVLARHGHPKLAAELVVERGEIAAQPLLAFGVELTSNGLGPAVAGREEAPGRLLHLFTIAD